MLAVASENITLFEATRDLAMRTQVAQEKEPLEGEDAGGPHHRSPPEPRQELLAENELDLEEEEGAGEYGGSEGHGSCG